MVGRERHGGIFSALNRRDLNTIKDFYRWALESEEVEEEGGISLEQQADIFVGNPILPQEDLDEGDIESANLDDIQEALESHIETLVGPEAFQYQRRIFSGGKSDPGAEVLYSVHKRWAARLQKIVNKIKNYRYKIHNEELG